MPRLIPLVFLLAASLAAQTSPYAGSENRPIKALSESQQKELRAGAGMGLALAAELNGFPGPKHVLELSEKLALSPSQRAEVQRIFDRMGNDARLIGEKIIAAEKELDRAFGSAIDEKSLRDLTSRIAALQGELRYTHLQAHLTTTALLSRHQRHLYASLRGYESGGSHSQHDH